MGPWKEITRQIMGVWSYFFIVAISFINLRILNIFWPKKEYFSCVQFDKIAEIMNVRLRDQNRYEFLKKLKSKANFRYFSHTILFEKDWFYSLSPKARCSMLAHELWHSKTSRKYVATRVLVLFMYLVLFFVAMSIFVIGLTLERPYITGLLAFILFVFFETYGMTFLYRHLLWPFEFQSDEAAVSFLGVEATKEGLGTLSKRIHRFWPTHPPTGIRLERIEKLGKKYQKPVIDFDKLEKDIPQELVPIRS